MDVFSGVKLLTDDFLITGLIFVEHYKNLWN